MYISYYITKNDEQMHQVLTMFSRAVAKNPNIRTENEAQIRAKHMVHTCIAAWIGQTKIHAQQAVRYLRGKGDGMCSHPTGPTLSYSICSYLNCVNASKVKDNTDEEDENEPEENSKDEDDFEPETTTHRLSTDEDGEIIHSDQAEDYYYRDPALKSINFYDFIRCYQKRRLGRR